MDYGFHLGLCQVNDDVLAEIPAMVDAGVTSFHLRLDGVGERHINDGQLVEFLQRVAAAGALPCIQAENGEVIELFVRRLAAEGKTLARHICAARPPEVEAQATARAINLADMAKVPMYISSLSCAHAVEKVKAARDRGQIVYAETCAHYLILSNDRYEESEGIKFYCIPPLRPSWHADILWKAIISGDVHVVSSDHWSFNYAGQKDLGKDNFTQAPPGFVGIQERLAALFAAGVHTGKISANRLVDLLCTTPAKLFGLFPRKGTLAVGSDADMVIFDPKAETVLSKSKSLSRCDYTPYEGMRIRGAVWLVLQRGRVIARDGRVMGRPGAGEFLPRAKFSMP